MKIEKLTENKIRVVVNLDDLIENNTSLHALMAKTIESQSFFLDILSKAEKEVDFHTEGCKLLIEAFSSEDDILVLTITKYANQKEKQGLELKTSSDSVPKVKPTVKRKSINYSSKDAIYSFGDFDEFCEFCKYLHNSFNIDLKKIAKTFSLYNYNSTYYLIVQKINSDLSLLKHFHSIASEFGKPVFYSKSFINKLLEHGNPIMKKNAITTCVKYFG